MGVLLWGSPPPNRFLLSLWLPVFPGIKGYPEGVSGQSSASTASMPMVLMLTSPPMYSCKKCVWWGKHRTSNLPVWFRIPSLKRMSLAMSPSRCDKIYTPSTQASYSKSPLSKDLTSGSNNKSSSFSFQSGTDSRESWRTPHASIGMK